MTFGVGYTVLLWSYSGANRLHDWNSLDVFSKTLQTFAVGGIITFASLVLLNAPFDSFTNDPAFWDWFWHSRNIFPFALMEIAMFLLVYLVLREYLSRSLKEAREYII